MTDSTRTRRDPTRTRSRAGILLLGLAVLGLAGAAYAVRRPLLMSAPDCLAGRWSYCLGTFNGVVLMTLVALPVSAALVVALAAVRQVPWRLPLAEVGMVHGTLPWLWMTMIPNSGAGLVDGRVSLIPFQDLITMGPIGIIGNLLVLAALGFFAPIRFAALTSLPRILLLGAGCSILIETLQYVLRLDRVSSVDDVLLNAAGAVLAGWASRRWWRRDQAILR